MDNAAAVLYRPTTSFLLAPAEPWFREPAQGQQLTQFAVCAHLQFGEGKRVQSQEMAAALKRIAAETVQIEPAASGDQYPLAWPVGIVQPLEKVAPVTVLVYFIKQPKTRIRQIARKNPAAVFVNVPIQKLPRQFSIPVQICRVAMTRHGVLAGHQPKLSIWLMSFSWSGLRPVAER